MQLAESLLESGISAMKIWPFDPPAQENHGLYITAAQMKKAVEPFEKIRKAVGDKMEIMVEFHSLWNLPTAKQIARVLEAYKPTWYEDPIRMNSPQALAEYARSTDVWVCASETLGSRYPYKDMLDRDAVHVVMADLCWTGGLTEGRKIAAMAETYHRPFAPHDCIGPVGFIAAVHMSFSQPNTLIQESVRAFYKGLVQRACHDDAGDQGWLCLSDGRRGALCRSSACGIRPLRPDRAPQPTCEDSADVARTVRSLRPHRSGDGLLARSRPRHRRRHGEGRRAAHHQWGRPRARGRCCRRVSRRRASG